MISGRILSVTCAIVLPWLMLASMQLILDVQLLDTSHQLTNCTGLGTMSSELIGEVLAGTSIVTFAGGLWMTVALFIAYSVEGMKDRCIYHLFLLIPMFLLEIFQMVWAGICLFAYSSNTSTNMHCQFYYEILKYLSLVTYLRVVIFLLSVSIYICSMKVVRNGLMSSFLNSPIENIGLSIIGKPVESAA